MSGVYLFRIPRAGNYGPALSYRCTTPDSHKGGGGSKVLVFLDIPYEREYSSKSRSGVAFCPLLVMSDARHSGWNETKLVRLGRLVAEMDRSDTSGRPTSPYTGHAGGEKRDRLSPSDTLRPALSTGGDV